MDGKHFDPFKSSSSDENNDDEWPEKNDKAGHFDPFKAPSSENAMKSERPDYSDMPPMPETPKKSEDTKPAADDKASESAAAEKESEESSENSDAKTEDKPGDKKAAPNPVPEHLGAPLNPAPEDIAPTPEAEEKDEKPEESFLQPAPEYDDPNYDLEPDRTPEHAKPVKDGSEDPQVPQEVRNRIPEEQRNYLELGQTITLSQIDLSIRKLLIGAGWTQRSIGGTPTDLDLSIFLLDRTDQTRIDEDFIFYNNREGAGGAIVHKGDSRTGAGDGDDEQIEIDLTGISFEVLKLLFVFSIYDEQYEGFNFGQIRDLYIRFENLETRRELFRFNIPEEMIEKGMALKAGVLIREGPEWIFEAKPELVEGELAQVATEYGIIVKELQSTGAD